MRIVFAGGGTGGHLYPGLAIARAVQRTRPDIKPFFIGARRGIEREVLPTTGYPHVLLDLHPLYRTKVWNNWRTAVGMFTAWRGIGKVFREEKPALVVGTGGYAAVASLAYAVAHGIPIVEQTGDSLPSLTARLFSRWCREVYLSFPESARHLRARSPEVLVDTGAPIEPPHRLDRAEMLRKWRFPADARVVLAYGGSQGSLAINNAVRDWIAGGLTGATHVLWASGRSSYESFRRLDSDRVRVMPYLSPMSEAYSVADLAVARGGTMTLAELLAWRIPAIVVPLPTAAANHQELNAVALEQAGAAVHLPQSRLTGASLGDTIVSLLNDPMRRETIVKAASLRARPNAAEEIAQRVITIAESSRTK